MAGNQIRIIKNGEMGCRVELNGKLLEGVSWIKIKNDYTPEGAQEQVIICLMNISSLEICDNYGENKEK
ncbi:hypothetical protein A2U11_08565 [Fusobacterium necrophorum subsp. funduliforme]|uniref:hypothetical protein n=1 Tax=Fusobacterium necrophorum TaxID=859 RepID=UPI0007872EFB|nr:hypothetical protein [Fusobacterium necrophorum]KYM50749.1 hypothetical protein A2U11_08565 [Fusobacterium necrophorum subsp. funduliforme]